MGRGLGGRNGTMKKRISKTAEKRVFSRILQEENFPEDFF
jgi:hypothetical protein